MVLTKEVIQGFVGGLLSENFDGAVESPEFHEECWTFCTSRSPKVAIAAPRHHAKTSGITLGYGLATLLFRERKFMLLVSDTESQACLFLGNYKQELQNNTRLIDLFDLKKDDNGKVLFVKDTESDIIVQCNDGHLFRVIAKGAEQKLRGLLWNGSRPDIILCDDMENDELVMNKDRREKMRRWFYSALLPCLSQNGVIRVVGTILHMDSLLERLMPEHQIGMRRRDEKTLAIEDLKTFAKIRTPWKSVRYRAHDSSYTLFLWPQRYDAEYFKQKYEDYLLQGIPDAYSQEYLNTPLDEATSYFKRNDFLPRTESDKKLKLNYYIAVDLAVSEAARADWSVFVVAGVDENRIIHVVNVVRERIDARDIVDTLVSLQRVYDPVAVGIEDMQVSKSIGPFLKEEMIKQNTFINLLQLKHGGKDKIARAKSIQARMRTGSVKFDTSADWFDIFQSECLRFPRDKHDDQVDAFAYLGMMLNELIEAPTKQETEEEEYLELYERNLSGHGRSNVTGY
jgi:predicted phage terminase large subunit-like protein